jgi:hypothetical protein
MCNSERGGQPLEKAGWQQSEFFASNNSTTPRKVKGWTRAGIGIECLMAPMAIAPKVGLWLLYHLGSGHLLAVTRHDATHVAGVGNELLTLGDWEFDGLYGFQNSSPDLPERYKAFLRRHPDCAPDTGQGHSDKGAHAVVFARLR